MVQHIPAHVLDGAAQSLTQAGAAMPQAATCWASSEEQTHIEKRHLHLQFPLPCPALQVKTLTSPLWDLVMVSLSNAELTFISSQD